MDNQNFKQMKCFEKPNYCKKWWLIIILLPLIFSITSIRLIANPGKKLITNNDSTTTKYVMISSIPAKATVIVDGEIVGETPVLLQLSIGNHQIKAFLSGFPEYLKTLFVTEKLDKVEILFKQSHSNTTYNDLIQSDKTKTTTKYFSKFKISDFGTTQENNPQQAQYDSHNKYNRKFEASVLIGATAGIITIAAAGVAHSKYNQYKESYNNRDELKRQIQILDAISVGSLTLCLASAYLAIHYSIQSKKSDQSGNLKISLIPMDKGAGISFNYKLP